MDLLCLIFSGKIMKDTETLAGHKLADGFVVHLVIKSSARGPQEPMSPQSPSQGDTTTSSSNNQTQRTNFILLIHIRDAANIVFYLKNICSSNWSNIQL